MKGLATFYVFYRFNLLYLQNEKAEEMKKGRNSNLIALRDEALCRRYYYWTEVQRLRFDDALRLLSTQEFFISEERIMAIIRKKCSEVKDLEIKPVPKVRKPRLTSRQLELFQDTAV